MHRVRNPACRRGGVFLQTCWLESPGSCRRLSKAYRASSLKSRRFVKLVCRRDPPAACVYVHHQCREEDRREMASGSDQIHAGSDRSGGGGAICRRAAASQAVLSYVDSPKLEKVRRWEMLAELYRLLASGSRLWLATGELFLRIVHGQ